MSIYKVNGVDLDDWFEQGSPGPDPVIYSEGGVNLSDKYLRLSDGLQGLPTDLYYSNGVDLGDIFAANPNLFIVSNEFTEETTSWSTALTTTVDTTYSDMEQFFHLSGQIRYSFEHTGGSSSDAVQSMKNLLNNSEVYLEENTSVSVGTEGTATNVGFQNLTTTYQTIFYAEADDPYEQKSIEVEVRSPSTNQLQSRITLSSSGDFNIDGTTRKFVGQRRHEVFESSDFNFGTNIF